MLVPYNIIKQCVFVHMGPCMNLRLVALGWDIAWLYSQDPYEGTHITQ